MDLSVMVLVTVLVTAQRTSKRLSKAARLQADDGLEASEEQPTQKQTNVRERQEYVRGIREAQGCSLHEPTRKTINNKVVKYDLSTVRLLTDNS
jgi:hypothetical protein